MEEVLVVLTANDPAAVRQKVEAAGGHILQSYGQRVLIVEAAPRVIALLKTHPGVVGVYPGPAPDDASRRLDEIGRLGVAAWNHRHSAAYQAAKRTRKGEGLAWDHPDFEAEGRETP